MPQARSHNPSVHWPRTGLIWPTGNTTKVIRPIGENRRWRDAIFRALDSQEGEIRTKAFVDKCFTDLVIQAKALIPRLEEISVIDYFDEVRQRVPWATGLHPVILGALFVELTRARAQWWANPKAPHDVNQHSPCAREVDGFREALYNSLSHIKYVVLDLDDNGNFDQVSEGPIAFFIDSGLLGDLPQDQTIKSELENGVHRLTISGNQGLEEEDEVVEIHV